MCAGNIWKARLFDNDGILEGTGNIGLETFGLERYRQLSEVAKSVRVGEIMEDGMIKNKEAVERVLALRINMAEYFRLRNVCHRIRQLYGGSEGEGTCLDGETTYS